MPAARDNAMGLSRVQTLLISWFYSVFRRVVVNVSTRTAYRLGSWVNGLYARPLMPHRLENYRQFFGAADKVRDTQLEHEHRAYLTNVLIEGIRDQRVSRESIREQSVFSGHEHIADALKLGKGVLLLSGHVGNFYSSHQLLSVHGYAVTTIRNRVPFPSMERQTTRIWARFNLAAAFIDENAARTAVTVFKKNGILSVLFDVLIRREHAVRLPFGNAHLDFDLGPALLAIRYGVPVLPVSLDSAPSHHRMCVQPALPMPAEGTERERALRLLTLWRDWLEDEVTQKPAQWWAWSAVRLCAAHPDGTS
jgi:lauroyl/myristoyl acyltransferase